MVAKPAKSKGKLPISRHPLFALMVALWFAALFGLGSLAIRPTLLEAFVLAIRLDLVVPAAAPPLGFTFRVLLALILFVVGGATGFFLARRIARGRQPKPEGRQFTARTAAPARDNFKEGDDFARLDAAREASAIPANAIPGRRRALAMEEDFSTEHHDLAPLPGGPPQILDLADLGPMNELEAEDIDEAVDAGQEFVASAGPEPVQFDPWQRHQPFEAAMASVDPQTAPEPVADNALQPRSFDAPSQGFAAPSQSFAAQVEPLAEVVAFVPEAIAAPEPVAAAPLAAPFKPEPPQFAPPPFAAPQGEERPAFAAPPAPPERAFAPPADLIPLTFAAPVLAEEAVPVVAAVVVEDHSAEPVAPAFGSVSDDAAEQLVAAPLGSLGIVQLAERLALAISRKRGSASDSESLAAFAQPPVPPVPAAILQPPAMPAPLPMAFAAPEAAPEAPVPETAAPAQFAAPQAPAPNPVQAAMPAALRPLSFDDDSDDALASILAPRNFAMPTAPVVHEPVVPEPVVIAEMPSFADPEPEVSAEQEISEAAEAAEDDGYASLLGMKPANRPFVRIEEPEPAAEEIEPVVIFPGQDQRPAAFASPSADPVRRFDAPPVPSVPLRVPNAASRPIDAEETERALKAALATLQRMSGAA